jgi:hypothetical protein
MIHLSVNIRRHRLLLELVSGGAKAVSIAVAIKANADQ